MGAGQHVVSLPQSAVIGERAAIGAEQLAVILEDQHGVLEHGQCLRILLKSPQGARVIQGGIAVLRIGVVALPPALALGLPVGRGAGLARLAASIEPVTSPRPPRP